MKNLLLSLFALLSFPFAVWSQPNIKYDVSRINKKCFKNVTEFYYFDIFCTSHGSVYATGGTNASNSDALLCKLNTNFDTLWTKTYGGSNDDRWLNIMELPNGNLVLSGTTSSHDGDVWYGHTYTAKELWVVIVDTNGNIVKGTTFGGSNGSELEDASVSSDGNLYLSGTTIASDYDFTHPSFGFLDQDCWYAKLDSNLNLKWVKFVGGLDDEGGTFFQEVNANRFVFGLLTLATDSATLGSQAKGGTDILVGMFDSLGNTIWKKRYGTFGFDASIHCIVDSTKGWIYILGQNGEYGMDVNYATGIGNNWILKIDTNAQVLASSAYGLTGINPTRSIDFKYYDNHLWLTTATKLSGGDIGVNTTGNTNAWIAMIDTNCQLVGKLTIDGNWQDYPLAHSLLVINNSLYYYGYTQGYSPNTEGCNPLIDSICPHIEKLITYPLGVSSSLGTSEKLIQLYPNPSYNNVVLAKLNAKACEVTISDQQGKLIYSSTMKKDKMTIDCSTWPSGFYLITCTSKNLTQNLQFLKQ